jgi:HSP20 family protein
MTLLMRPEPFTQEFDRLFSSLFNDTRTRGGTVQRWVPPMDLVEADEHFVLKADLPGLAEDDVAIEVQDNVLTVSGSREAEHERKEQGWYRLERSYGSFSRALTLPDGVDADRVEARFDRGVLEVRIPKPEERKPRRIAIGANGNANRKTIEGSTA